MMFFSLILGFCSAQQVVVFDSIGPANEALALAGGNFISQAFQATWTSEFGDKISFTVPAPVLTRIDVMMVSSFCQSQSGPAPVVCTSTAGDTFNQPLILTLYSADLSTRLYQQQATCDIPYRPTSDPTCPAPGPGSPCRAEGCWKSPDGNCRNGIAHLCSFTLPFISVPQTIVWTMAYPTRTYPTVDRNVGGSGGILLQKLGGVSGFASFLNVAVKYESVPTTGTNVVPNAIVRFTEQQRISGGGLGNFRCSPQSPFAIAEDPMLANQTTSPCDTAYCPASQGGECLQPQARFWTTIFEGNE